MHCMYTGFTLYIWYSGKEKHLLFLLCEVPDHKIESPKMCQDRPTPRHNLSTCIGIAIAIIIFKLG